MLEIDQNDYLKKLKPLPEDAKFNDFAVMTFVIILTVLHPCIVILLTV